MKPNADSACIHTAEFLSANDGRASESSPPGDGSEAARHIEHCPECAELARVSANLDQVMAARATASAVDVGPGFSSRMIAGATRRLAVRRRNRIAITAASACAAVLLVAGMAAQLTGEGGPRAVAIDDAIDDNRTERSTDLAFDEAAESTADVPDTPVDLAVADAGRELTSELVELIDPEQPLAYQADWKVGGGHVAPSEIVAAGEHLGLDRKQTAELRRLMADLEKAEHKTQTEGDRVNAELRNLLGQSNPDPARVGALIDKISGLEAAMRKRRVLTWLQARKLLTGVQRRALERLQNRHHSRRRGEHDHEHTRGEQRHEHAVDGHDGLDIDIDIDGDGVDVRIDEAEIERAVTEALKEAQEELEGLEELETPEELPTEALEALERAEHDLHREWNKLPREELRRLREQMRNMRKRLRGQAKELRKEAKRARKEALEHAKRARKEALEHAKRARKEALAEAKRARKEALKHAQRAREQAARGRERAMRDAERIRRQVQEAHRRAAERMRRGGQQHGPHGGHGGDGDFDIDFDFDFDIEVEPDECHGNGHGHGHDHGHDHGDDDADDDDDDDDDDDGDCGHHHTSGSPNTGALQVASTPSARVLVDGKAVGTTPLRTQLVSGIHAVQLVFPNGKKTQRAVRVPAGSQTGSRRR